MNVLPFRELKDVTSSLIRRKHLPFHSLIYAMRQRFTEQFQTPSIVLLETDLFKKERGRDPNICSLEVHIRRQKINKKIW